MANSLPFIVTGAASGIGHATATRLIERGHDIISLDLKEPGANVKAHYQCDLSQRESIDEVVSKLDGTYASLVNIAGVPDTVGDELTMRVNTFGLRHLTEQLWDRIADAGTVVNVASIAGNNWRKRRNLINAMLDTDGFDAALAWWAENQDNTGIDAYTLSKEAVVMYTMRLAGRGLGRGITVNDVGPGPVDTPLLPDFTAAVGADNMKQLISSVGRAAQPDDIAQALVVLAEGQMRWVNGQHLVVDGGLTAGFSAGWAGS
jgi:NAD(P)-dependent dehydrogenase (short-subunit alcohol dehydrogenase family)